jgi:hypothetical protein
MVEEAIPLAVQQFLLTRISSIAQLEALLLLFTDPAQRWDCQEISRRLYIDEALCSEILKSLTQQGLLLQQDDTYCFRCHPPELESTIRLVREHYTKHLIPVTNLIHSKPDGIQDFANAAIAKEK